MKKFASSLTLLTIVCLLSSCGGCVSKPEKHLKFFRYNQSSGITSLDPAFAKDQACTWACNQLFNSLTRVDDSLNIRPCIAKSWDISADGKTYFFHLRDDVYFQNDSCFPESRGRKVTTADVLFSLGRIIDKSVASPGAWIFNNNVDTTAPFTAIDDTTFRLQLSRSFPPMLGILSMQYCSVVPVEAVKKYGSLLRSHPVGTGPFMLRNWKEGVALIMVRNPTYFEKDGSASLPYLDGIKITFIDNKKTEYLSFKQKELDFINSIDESYIDEVLDDNGNLKAELGAQFNLFKNAYLNTEYLGFYTAAVPGKDNPFLDMRLRKAINYGFDRSEMLKYLRKGIGKPAESGFTPYGLPSFDAEKVKGYHYDLAKARELLKEAGHENGKGLPELELYTNETYKEYALFISKQLEQIGLKIKVEIVQPAILREWMSAGKVNFFRGSWLADYPDAENYFAVFYSKNGAPPNYTRFNNRDYDALYEKALAENDIARRYELYHQLDNIIIRDAPVVPLFYDEILTFTQKNVEGLKPNASNLLDLRRVRIK